MWFCNSSVLFFFHSFFLGFVYLPSTVTMVGKLMGDWNINLFLVVLFCMIDFGMSFCHHFFFN